MRRGIVQQHANIRRPGEGEKQGMHGTGSGEGVKGVPDVDSTRVTRTPSPDSKPIPTSDAALTAEEAARLRTQMESLTNMSKGYRLYVWLACFFCSCLIIADIVGIKLFRIPLGVALPLPGLDSPIEAIVHTCGMLTFPVTFILTDLINDYYGKKGARRITWMGLAMASFVFVVINIAEHMPYLDAPYNVRKESFDAVFSSAKIMYVASLIAYTVGQLSDIFLFGVIKKLTRGRYIWLRATGSTLISQFIDSVIVSVMAWHVLRHIFPEEGSPPMALQDAVKTGLTGYVLKFFLAIGVTPVIYIGHMLIRKYIGIRPLPSDQIS